MKKLVLAACATLGTIMVMAGPAMAGVADSSNDNLPGPGVLGLVAVAVVGAIAVARFRK
jgi:hypothetical protein